MKKIRHSKGQSTPKTLLDQLLSQNKGLIPKVTLAELGMNETLTVIGELATFVIRNPEKNVIFGKFKCRFDNPLVDLAHAYALSCD